MRDEPVAALHLSDDQIGGLSPVESVGASISDAAQRGGELGLSKCLADVHDPASREEGGGRRFVKPEVALFVGDVAAEALVDLEAVGQLGRRLHQIGPGQRAEPSMGLPQAHHGARYAHGQVPQHRLAGQLPTVIEEHVARGLERCFFSVVEGRGGPIRHSHDHEATAPDIPRVRLDHGQGEGYGDRRVYRVPTLLHDPSA